MDNSTLFKNMMNNLSDEDKEKYKKIGEYMYNTIDYENNEILNKIKTPTEEILGYIEIALKSGLSAEDLEPEERKYMKDQFGNKWFERYGFTLDDIPSSEHREYSVSLENNNTYQNTKETKRKKKTILRKQGGKRMIVRR